MTLTIASRKRWRKMSNYVFHDHQADLGHPLTAHMNISTLRWSNSSFKDATGNLLIETWNEAGDNVILVVSKKELLAVLNSDEARPNDQGVAITCSPSNAKVHEARNE